MTTVGFSYAIDIIRVAQREDFWVFFETIKNIHAHGFKKSMFARTLGKGRLPLMASKLWRGWVPYDEMGKLEEELTLTKEIFSKMPLSAARMDELTDETELDATGVNWLRFSTVYLGDWRTRFLIQGSFIS